MNRPYIFCHMVTSIDGKIDGPHKALPERQASADFFYNVAFGKNPYYDMQAWLSGRRQRMNLLPNIKHQN